jgi:hypothetical protein
MMTRGGRVGGQVFKRYYSGWFSGGGTKMVLIILRRWIQCSEGGSFGHGRVVLCNGDDSLKCRKILYIVRYVRENTGWSTAL